MVLKIKLICGDVVLITAQFYPYFLSKSKLKGEIMIAICKSGFYFLLLFLILLGIFGCGDDEEALENLIGTWELVTVDGRTPRADLQSEMGTEATVLTAGVKYVFSSDGSLFQELTIQAMTRRIGFLRKSKRVLRLTPPLPNDTIF